MQLLFKLDGNMKTQLIEIYKGIEITGTKTTQRDGVVRFYIYEAIAPNGDSISSASLTTLKQKISKKIKNN